MATTLNPEKKIDLPPRGDRNADPITDAAGAHPIETGIGAAAAGAVSGLAVGAFAGPVAAAIGAAVGAVAGGYAGKGIGEMIDPTTEDNWLRDNFASRPYVDEGDHFEDFQPAYRYVLRSNRNTEIQVSIRLWTMSRKTGPRPRVIPA